ncbi:hypothetical protein BAE44_0024495 [Dichanthelium oligosanthes]|uniref:Uncharacterized protein n=1 Tax=Dichanthelium oligosanthes TaxID=888268 RepID=A0A1E5UNQ8_9POAL|nr:hypothetical protein BAE44_0024495 [Dichanthelium oligosanthes]
MDEYVWSIHILEAVTLEPENGGFVNKHESFILEEPQDPSSPKMAPESRIHCANRTYESYNHLMLLDHNNFRRMAIDAFIYHKYCKSHSHVSFGTNLAARAMTIFQKLVMEEEATRQG